jgi:hypothetical protein
MLVGSMCSYLQTSSTLLQHACWPGVEFMLYGHHACGQHAQPPVDVKHSTFMSHACCAGLELVLYGHLLKLVHQNILPSLLLSAVSYPLLSAAGPWFCAQMSSSSQGLGLWFRYGLLLPLPVDLSPSWIHGDAGSPFLGPGTPDSDGNTVSSTSSGEDIIDLSAGWQEYVWMGLPDTHLISSLTVCITVAPMTLWLGLVMWHWHNVAAAARRSSLGGGVAAAQGAAAAVAVLAAAGTQVSKPLAEAGVWLQQQLGVGKSAANASCGASSVCCSEGAGLQLPEVSSSGSTPNAEGAAAGVTGGSGSSSSSALSPQRLARCRSGNATLRRRESTELTAEDDGGGASNIPVGRQQQRAEFAAVGSSSSGAESRSSSSCLLEGGNREASVVAAEAAEEEVQLCMRSSPSAGGATAAFGANLLQSVMPVAAIDPLPGGKQQQGQRRWLSPRYLACCLLYLVVVCARGVMRPAQLYLVSLRIPLPLLLLAVPPVAFWFKVCWRLAAAYGPVALVVSPVVGWLPVLMLLALHRARRDVAAGKARRQD